jgi:hypothetical protein
MRTMRSIESGSSGSMDDVFCDTGRSMRLIALRFYWSMRVVFLMRWTRLKSVEIDGIGNNEEAGRRPKWMLGASSRTFSTIFYADEGIGNKVKEDVDPNESNKLPHVRSLPSSTEMKESEKKSTSTQMNAWSKNAYRYNLPHVHSLPSSWIHQWP